ncbi:MAG: hypothetical protein H6648_08465 [Caldilineae bacterium]|nr:hypothetical protein [Caldilineae bacterium]
MAEPAFDPTERPRLGPGRARVDLPPAPMGRRLAGLALLAGLAPLAGLALLAGCRPAASPALAARITVADSGPVRVSARDLARAGLDWRDRNPSDLRLYAEGRPYPARVQAAPDAGGFRLDFYAGPVTERYDGRRRFLLVAGRERPAWMAPAVDVEDGLAARPGETESPPGDRAMATVEHRPRLRYIPRRPEGPWIGEMLAAPKGEVEIQLAVEGLAEGPGQLRLALWSDTSAPADPDHRLAIAVNGRPLAEQRWDGAGDHAIRLDLPAGLLREGDNRVRLSLPGLPEVRAEISYLVALSLDYPLRPLAHRDRLAFRAGDRPLPLAGFSGPADVFELDASGEARWLVNAAALGRAADGRAVDAIESRAGWRYLAVGPKGWSAPESIRPVSSQPDLRQLPGADWLAIAPSGLAAPLEPLLARRRAQGLEARWLPLEAVVDQFGQGSPEPEAIRSFLRMARSRWAVPPRYLLLVGDMSEDTWAAADGGPPEPWRLPTLFVDTAFGGLTAADGPMADLDGDGWPELPVGRVPARRPDQVATFVAKTLAFEAAGAQPWQARLVAVADGSEPGFRSDAEGFMDRFGPLEASTLVAPESGATDGAARIAEALGAGAGFLAYFGHGSLDRWGRDGLLRPSDLPGLLPSGRPAIVLHMTCLTGLFTAGEGESLAEAMLWQPAGGAVAQLAPTSLTLGGDQLPLSRSLAETLGLARAEGQSLRLGDALMPAWRASSQELPAAGDVARTFLLFGDPALSIAP